MVKVWLQCQKIPILEVVIGREEVQMENNKVKAVRDQKIPIKIKKSGKLFGICKLLSTLYQEL